MLSTHGVTAMMTEYDGPHVSAVSFRMNLDGKPMGFKLPCDWRAVVEIFKKQNVRLKHGGTLQEQAIRTAWRIIKDWTEALLALVEVNMVTVPQGLPALRDHARRPDARRDRDRQSGLPARLGGKLRNGRNTRGAYFQC
jgi:hypothetical protein